ncbi:hypothetical protein SLEP1_g45334 [Rubroshorea leprosula]|uniref:Uncharacterized protein n=1 Tax=Rubroshorea leprosula TaxID=152421 RepID=A0AAV5LIW1_9ROSI|nr:hypothetical protein SLEP1_g45334 [Rubroshorea leprosula]
MSCNLYDRLVSVCSLQCPQYSFPRSDWWVLKPCGCLPQDLI